MQHSWWLETKDMDWAGQSDVILITVIISRDYVTYLAWLRYVFSVITLHNHGIMIRTLLDIREKSKMDGNISMEKFSVRNKSEYKYNPRLWLKPEITMQFLKN